NQNLEYKKIIGHMKDWIDDDIVRESGGSEREYYSEYPQRDNLPPNRAFRTIEEIRLIPWMTDEIYQMLASRITVYGVHAINPNYAPRDVLMSLDASITDEVATELISRRQDDDKGGLFQNENDFWSYVNGPAGG